MKRIISTVSLILLSGSMALASILYIGKKEMVAQSELIAIVDIQELASTDKTRIYVDLIATGHVNEVLKGDANRGEITFRIPRFFPCAVFDVSTGRHVVFLKKNEKGEYVGVNWHMSYLHLGRKTVQWFSEEGTNTPEEVVEEVETLIRKSP